MSSSIICQNFVQNAWKKELCSNCFKSKDEHRKSAGHTSASNAIAAMLKSTTLNSLNKKSSTLTTNPNEHKREPVVIETRTKSIIKTTTTKRPKRSVNFKVKLAQVIGYGGEDWSEEEEDVVAYEETEEDESPTEEEKELNRLTQSNTDFNTSLTLKKLQLGAPQVDSEGRKKTLIVQVTPFGEEAKEPSKQRITNRFTQNEIKTNLGTPEAKSRDVVDFVQTPTNSLEKEKFKEVTEEVNTLNDTKLKINETSPRKEEKSLLDEITETLEKSKISVSPVKKIVQKEIILKPVLGVPKENKEPKLTVTTTTKLTRNPAIKEKKTYQSSKSLNLILDQEINNEVNDKEKNKEIEKQKQKEYEDKEDKDSANGGSSLDDSSSHCGSEDSNSDSSLEGLPKSSYENIQIPSRELVGEPDGRAESDGTDEPIPALPTTAPPSVPAPVSIEKPKIPIKPSTILIRKPPSIMNVNQVVLSTFNSDKSHKMGKPNLGVGVYSQTSQTQTSPILHTQLQKRDSDSSDIGKKRKAPKPPQEDALSSIYTRKPITMSTDCPVVREKEKRERASSCTPKIATIGPEPAPRRSLSLSTDSLASNGDEKKKRAKFSLKKFLRMGSGNGKSEEEKPLPKPRLVIVHPLDMNEGKELNLKEQEYVNTTYLKEQIQLLKDKENSRPPPPPRNYENYEKPDKLPPKTNQIKNLVTQQPQLKKLDSVYANIGEVRNAITPNKPQRTASMREIKDGVVVTRNAYEPVAAPSMLHTAQNLEMERKLAKPEEHVYDYIGNRSSSPECDSKTNKTCDVSGASHQSSGAQNGHQGGMSRSVSMTYCGSETESEIYSPYSYYGSESEVAEDEQECCYGNGLGSTGRTHKLRSKKGRSIVHKNLEDNYGAVVVANHEALAQVLENIQQTMHVPLHLRALKTTENLRWNDFTLRPNSLTGPSQQSITIGNCAFHQATWNQQNVTLMITIVPNSPNCSLGTLILQPVTEFSDLVPSTVLPQRHRSEVPIQATISVLSNLQIHSVSTIGELFKLGKQPDGTNQNSETYKASTVLLLQLVNSLKTLQAQGVEELPLNLNSFVMAKDLEKQEVHARLYILHPNEEPRQEMGTLCLVVSRAMDLLPMDALLRKLVHSLLSSERAVTLSQVKSVLEFSLWGPSDVALGSTCTEREFVLQRWLDLQRATVLHGLVCAKVQLTVYEECHLLFLVRSNAKMMCDASLLLESVRKC